MDSYRAIVAGGVAADVEEIAARAGLRVARTRLPSAVPVLVVGAAILCAPSASPRDVLVAVAGELLRRDRAFAAHDAVGLGGELAQLLK
jgi:hypothetical protein